MEQKEWVYHRFGGVPKWPWLWPRYDNAIVTDFFILAWCSWPLLPLPCVFPEMHPCASWPHLYQLGSLWLLDTNQEQLYCTKLFVWAPRGRLILLFMLHLVNYLLVCFKCQNIKTRLKKWKARYQDCRKDPHFQWAEARLQPCLGAQLSETQIAHSACAQMATGAVMTSDNSNNSQWHPTI